MKRFVMVLLLFLTGCASLSPHEYGSLVGPLQKGVTPDRSKLALNNYSTLKYRYGEEWTLNKRDKNSTPLVGISLSGGGSRSASFSMGVLKGLQEIKVIDQTDIMSSVSGGGYALSWFYLQQLYAPKYDLPGIQHLSGCDLFHNSGKYQNYLATNGELMGASNIDLIRLGNYAIYGLATVVSQPVNIIANGVFGWHANVAPIRWVYQNGIEREYHVVPTGDDNNKLNNHRLLGIPTGAGVKDETEFKELRDFVLARELPLPVINTTTHISDCSVTECGELKNKVFEFTPLSYGSDYYGFRSDKFPVSVNKAVAISGGALDSKKIGNGFLSSLASSANMDLGYYIDNYNLTTSQRTWPKLLPWPLYYLSGRYWKDINGTSIYLADGGHAENLGAYSLIRRLTKNIIIVDAEEDPKYLFGSYRKLKEAVREELGAELKVKAIDDRLALCLEPKNDTVRDQCRNFGDKTVMNGTIEAIPFAEKGQLSRRGDEVTIQVLYVKMSIDKTKVRKNHNTETWTYPLSVSNYYLLHEDDGKNFINQHGAFPQQSISDETYDIYQFSAYRDLGYEIVKQNKSIFDAFLGRSK